MLFGPSSDSPFLVPNGDMAAAAEAESANCCWTEGLPPLLLPSLLMLLPLLLLLLLVGLLFSCKELCWCCVTYLSKIQGCVDGHRRL